MMRVLAKALVFPAAVCLLAACSKVEKVEVRNEAGLITERYYRNKADSTRQGKYEYYDDDGKLIETAFYANDQLQGTRTLYFPNGEKQYEEERVAGKFEGAYRAYYPDGTLEQEGQYANDEGTGQWTGYYPSGAKKEEFTMVNSIAEGPFREWHPNGALKAEGQYVGGNKEQGELLMYDERGELERRMYCEAGICRTMWLRDQTATDEGK